MSKESRREIVFKLTQKVNSNFNDQGLLYQFSEGSRAVDRKDLVIATTGAVAAVTGFGLLFFGNYAGREIGLAGPIIGTATLGISTVLLYFRNPVGFRNRIIHTYMD